MKSSNVAKFAGASFINLVDENNESVLTSLWDDTFMDTAFNFSYDGDEYKFDRILVNLNNGNKYYDFRQMQRDPKGDVQTR